MINYTPLTEAPPLFTDHTLSELVGARLTLKENIRLANAKGRLLILKPVWVKNLRRINRVLAARNLKATA